MIICHRTINVARFHKEKERFFLRVSGDDKTGMMARYAISLHTLYRCTDLLLPVNPTAGDDGGLCRYLHNGCHAIFSEHYPAKGV